MRLLLVLVLALVLALPAQAHVSDMSQSQTLEVGPYLVFFEPRPTPPFANSSLSLIAQVSDANSGALLRNVPATVVVGGPSGFNERHAMDPDGTGYLLARTIVPERGNYSARLLLKDPATNETHPADVEFEVFPDLPFRIRPVDAAADTFVGQRTTLAFEVVDPITLAPKVAFNDLRIRVEHWSEDHTTFLGAEDTVATNARGVWRLEHTFPESGMYHLRFASDAGGFNYADVPLLHVYATAPIVEEKQSPGAAFGAIVGLVLVAAALRRR